jgi:saccharopine dehydrogenase (NAD+, L-lysine-forming)
MPPFLTRELLDKTEGRRLSAITDVSCDPNSAFNPLPIYDSITSW